MLIWLPSSFIHSVLNCFARVKETTGTDGTVVHEEIEGVIRQVFEHFDEREGDI